MSASRFEVFNTETGEAVQSFPFPNTHRRLRLLALGRAKNLALAYPLRPYAIRLWVGGNPIPTTVYSPHNL